MRMAFPSRSAPSHSKNLFSCTLFPLPVWTRSLHSLTLHILTKNLKKKKTLNVISCLQRQQHQHNSKKTKKKTSQQIGTNVCVEEKLKSAFKCSVDRRRLWYDRKSHRLSAKRWKLWTCKGQQIKKKIKWEKQQKASSKSQHFSFFFTQSLQEVWHFVLNVPKWPLIEADV